uniref:Copper homeostasis protein cutC homolog n=1 Tax=Globodera pallida TaxID=36090 RepID=A0A183CM76_GLOPA
MPTILLEVCVDDADGLWAAIQGGADRIELCSALELGGLTPTPGLIDVARSVNKSVPIFAMIRPRSGDFSYSDREFESMCKDIECVAEAGLAGIAFGANHSDGTLDRHRLQILVKLAKVEVGRHQAQRAARLRLDQHVGQDRDRVAPLDHGLDVAQAPQQSCAFDRRLHQEPPGQYRPNLTRYRDLSDPYP